MASTEVIEWLCYIGLNDRPQVGGKGGSLGELQRAGIAVPPGFVVKTGAFERFIQALEAKSPLRARIAALNADDLPAAAACCAEIRARVIEEELPFELVDEITAAHIALCSQGV